MVARLRRRRSRRPDTGASAVEFALLSPVLFLMLFGIIDYGIWFSDSISARQALRDGARRGAVEDFGSCSQAASGPSRDLHNLACTIKGDMDLVGGNSYVRVSITTGPGTVGASSTGPGTATAGTWQQGGTLRVCEMTQHDSLLPLVPFPSGGISTTWVDIPIEQAGSGASSRESYSEAPPPGADWSWCTP